MIKEKTGGVELLSNKILITEKIHDLGISMLEAKYKVVKKYDLTRRELLDTIGDFSAIVVRVAHQIDKEMINEAKKLKVIATATIGLNHIDVKYAESRGIHVFNVPTGSTRSVAELTIGLMINIARNINTSYNSVKLGQWDKHSFVGKQLAEKTLGIVALGKIGTIVANIAQSIGMSVIAYDPFVSEEKSKSLGVKLVDFDELIKTADVVSIHAPLTKDTYHMFNKDVISRMKEHCIIINVGRGGIIDEEAVYNGLISGKLGGYGADVMEKEPPGFNPLYALPNVVITPHIGASTHDAQKVISEEVAKKVDEFLRK